MKLWIHAASGHQVASLINKLVNMAGPSTTLSNVASCALVRAEKEIQGQYEKNPKEVAACLALLAGKGWLDMDWIQLEISQEGGAGEKILGLMAQAQAQQLNMTVPQAPSRARTRL